MNCSEFQNISHELARDRVEGRDRIEALAHAGECPRCAEYLDEERRLTLKLGFLSQALHSQEAPARLESALLTAFREHAAHTEGSVPLHAGPRFWARQKFWGWATTAAALAAVIALAVGIYSRRRSQTEVPDASVSAPATQIHENAPTTAANSQQDDTQQQATIHTVRHPRKLSPRVRSGNGPLTTVSDNSGFVPLMYCDQLNCGTPGEIVRVEIPASSLPMMGLVSDNHTGPVRADVVVGEDGIARAIRLVDY
jgi:hypothetical protein